MWILIIWKKILNGKFVEMTELPKDLDTDDFPFYKYIPITSVDV